MRITLGAHVKTVLALEVKFNALMKKGDREGAFGVSVALAQYIRDSAEGLELSIVTPLRKGVVTNILAEVNQ